MYFPAVSDTVTHVPFEALYYYSKLFSLLSAFPSSLYSQTVGVPQRLELSPTLRFFPQKTHFQCCNYHLHAVNYKSRQSISSSQVSHGRLRILTCMSHIIIALLTLPSELRTGIPFPNYCPGST